MTTCMRSAKTMAPHSILNSLYFCVIILHIRSSFEPSATQHIVSACQPAVLPLYHTHSRSPPSDKAPGEDVPMEDNPAYGDVNIHDTVKEPKEN